MASYETFYTGSVYPFESPYGGFKGERAYHASVRDIAYPTDPLTANQLKKVSDKISTGAQTIEVSGLGLTGAGPMKHLASIPRQHWKEMDRLRKLTGVDLTFHGPLVESTGFSRGDWSEDQRLEAEKQMKAAVELAQQMNSTSEEKDKKGVVMTFHSNNGLPEVERKIMVDDGKGNRTEKTVQMAVFNERSGQIGNLPTPKNDYLELKGEQEDITRSLDKFNEDKWKRQIESVFVNNTRISREMVEALTSAKEDEEKLKKIAPQYSGSLFDGYKTYKNNYEEYKKGLEQIRKEDPEAASRLNSAVVNLQNADFFIKESYDQIKELYNEAYPDVIKSENAKAKTKMDNYGKELVNAYKKFKETSNFMELQEKITEGTKLLGDEGIKPKLYKPLRQFAVEKGSETFSNVALHAYQNAKEHGTAPGIISIENPPAGMSGLTRAEEIKELVEKSREKFIVKAVKDKIMSEKEATEVSKQIIGATWDVGHINSIQKWGYNRKEVLAQAEKIAPYVKHMHIADNLGFEDAELPVGMGNVPIDEILNAKWGENFRNAKKAIETGDWFSRQGGLGMTKTPVTEAFSGLTAPVYNTGPSMDSSAYWNSAIMNDGGYFGGLGPINPEVHHSIYGGGFSNLPAYLGGELPGKANNSSFSGAPLD